MPIVSVHAGVSSRRNPIVALKPVIMRSMQRKSWIVLVGAIAWGVLTLSACGGNMEGSANPTTGWGNPLQPRISWVLRSLNGSPLIEDTSIRLTIYEISVGGGDGCNAYGIQDAPQFVFVPSDTDSDGSYMEGEFSAQEIVRSTAACDRIEGVAEQADAYYMALGEGKTFHIRDNRLEILDSEGQVTLAFVRQPPLPGRQPGLAKTQWSLMGNKKAVTLAFLDDEVAVMVGECNDYIGKYRTSNRLLRFSGLWLMAPFEQCPWVDVVHSLRGPEQYSITGQAGSEQLTLGFSSGKPLALEALEAAALDTEQREWSLTNTVNFNNLTKAGSVVAEPVMTISFQENHISGSTGCNLYQASLKIDGEVVAIGPPSTTVASSCEQLENADKVMRQEERYLSFLPQMTRIGTYDERLFMSTGTGIYLVFEAG